jgi:hypothetical protein
MTKDAPELAVHKEWLGQIQQVGLVVSPHVLAKQGVGIERQRSLETQTRLREIASEADDPRVDTFLEFVTKVLEWPEGLLAGSPGGPDIPQALTVALPEHDDGLSPTYAIPDLAIISVVGTGADFDKPPADQKTGWRVSPHARLERLLRESAVPIGLLFNHTRLRLVYAPKGESSGHLTFRFKHLLETLGRPMAGALYALLGVERVTDVLPDAQRLPALLKESRKYQNVVSTKLAGQVLEALWQLLRGFQRANDETKGALLAEALRENPQEVYGGLLSTLMRLVFVLYAEDRDLMPRSDTYHKHYAVSGLFERLREDAALYPDTMDARFGAWAQLLALFRLIHDGGGHGNFRFPPRHGRLFNPDAYPFLEGRPLGSARVMGAPIDPPRVPDGVVFRVLQNLLMLDGERLSYRALDVEQIGSVYEAMMGFALQQATGPSIAVRPKHIVIDVTELLDRKPKERATWLQKQAELKVTGEALAKATTVDEAVAVLGKKVSRDYTPAALVAGSMFLQPTEERRRSGSHYTPRSLTAPIVQTTFRPIFERLGDQATPEQILDLKVCDPAMGSGAFLVEACRLLAERLVRAWEVHKIAPKVPDDEDLLTYARRLVAERCLYGVDKNIFAVDLAKLSLWLATLAREHPFTFLDHALRHGDSLVGLTREQIACFNWETGKQLPLLRGLIDARVEEAQALREQIQGMATSDDVPEKARLLKEADEALDDVRRIGDLVVSAFFEREKARDRHLLRTKYAADIQVWLDDSGGGATAPSGFSRTENPGPLTFHWQIEFPEVLSRLNPGFDVFVGNPPFAGKNTISASNAPAYLPWLLQLHKESHGNADLVAHFYRRAFDLLRESGTFGLIATNTISQGKTRGTGLGWICLHEGQIFSAQTRIVWPGDAAVVVSVVHVAKGAANLSVELDGRGVPSLNDALSTLGNYQPVALVDNAERSYIGSYLNGMGFTFDDADGEGMANPLSVMRQLVAHDGRNAERIRPYWGGAELNDTWSFEPVRYVIDLGSLEEDVARRSWPDLMNLLELRVWPERSRNSDERAQQFWWQFLRPRRELYEKLARLHRTLVTARNSDTGAFVWMPSDHVFSEKIVVFPTESDSFAAVLQSRVHEVWSRLRNTTLKDDLQYTPSECFENFPLPVNWCESKSLADSAVGYFTHRKSMQVNSRLGLTELLGRFNDQEDVEDPAIIQLRLLHAAMDRAVLDAYGWTDIQPTCEFILDYVDDEDDEPGKASKRKKPWRYRWPDEIRDEVLGRLLELNAQRAREEAAVGAVKPASTEARKSSKTRRSDTPLLD